MLFVRIWSIFFICNDALAAEHACYHFILRHLYLFKMAIEKRLEFIPKCLVAKKTYT